jgi:RNA-directed DNA polymerase
MNTDELALSVYRAQRGVLEIQTKLHRWSGEDPHRWFDDLYNLITDPAFLMVAWDRVRKQQGRAHGRSGRRDRRRP